MFERFNLGLPNSFHIHRNNNQNQLSILLELESAKLNLRFNENNKFSYSINLSRTFFENYRWWPCKNVHHRFLLKRACWSYFCAITVASSFSSFLLPGIWRIDGLLDNRFIFQLQFITKKNKQTNKNEKQLLGARYVSSLDFFFWFCLSFCYYGSLEQELDNLGWRRNDAKTTETKKTKLVLKNSLRNKG